MNEKSSPEFQGKERDIRYYLEVLAKYAPLIFIITIISVGLAVAITLNMHKVYQGEALLCIEPKDNAIMDNLRSSDQRAYTSRQTQIQMFHSRNLIKQTLSNLRTNGNYAFTLPNKNATESQLITAFSKKISLKSELRTDLVWLFVQDEDKKRARVYCNTLADAYVKFIYEREASVMEAYHRQIADNANAKKAELMAEEQSLLAFKTSNNYQNVTGHIEILNKEVIDLQHELRDLNDELSKPELERTRRFSLTEKVNDINASIEKKRSLIAGLDEVVKSVKVREMQCDAIRSEYQNLLSLVSKFALGSSVRGSNVRIVDYAELPQRPIKPHSVNNLIIGMIVGLAFGLSLAFFLEYLDDTLKTPDDVERYLGMPVMGTVPKMIASKDVHDVERIVEFYPKSIITESYQSIRTNILFSSAKPIKVLNVTSSSMSEGKTTTSVNLAQVMASAGDRVLLIDGDLRRPRLHKVYDLDNTVGLSTYLVGMREIKDLPKATTMPNLTIITAGPTPPVPVELLNSPRLGELIAWARENYDRVIIDAPPHMVVTDSIIISKHTDATLLVVHGGRTPRDQVRNGLQQLKKVNVNVIGVVLNNVDIRQSGYYRYGYSYSYYRSYRAYRSAYKSGSYKSTGAKKREEAKAKAKAGAADNRRKALEAYEQQMKQRLEGENKKDSAKS